MTLSNTEIVKIMSFLTRPHQKQQQPGCRSLFYAVAITLR
jgi:hypothetical protein